LHRLADWLKHVGITTVAMESTGIYWVPVYENLEERDLEVLLVNARDAKNVPGRKTDVNSLRQAVELYDTYQEKIHDCDKEIERCLTMGAFFRRLAARVGKAKAVIATARKIAVLFYNTLRYGWAYKDPGVGYYEERYRQRSLDNLRRRADRLGFKLVQSKPSQIGVS
jgi:hypothetical protein